MTAPGPRTAEASPGVALLRAVFARLAPVALGVAVGTVAGVLLLLATLVLVAKGGPVVGPTLGLLGQFFPGYGVSVVGAVVGLAYGFAVGFVVGWLVAVLHNVAVALVAVVVQFRSRVDAVEDVLDPDHA